MFVELGPTVDHNEHCRPRRQQVDTRHTKCQPKDAQSCIDRPTDITTTVTLPPLQSPIGSVHSYVTPSTVSHRFSPQLCYPLYGLPSVQSTVMLPPLRSPIGSVHSYVTPSMVSHRFRPQLCYPLYGLPSVQSTVTLPPLWSPIGSVHSYVTPSKVSHRFSPQFRHRCQPSSYSHRDR